MLLEQNGATPKIDPTARIAPNAVVCGKVTIGASSSIGFGAVLTAESGPITVGSNCVIMDTATIRGLKRNPVRIGDNVLVGPRTYLTGCEVEDNAFLATERQCLTDSSPIDDGSLPCDRYIRLGRYPRKLIG
jgi:carbonic anhydrase/acetyltransferase-like protein (isoleucine patch superfamily)